MIPKSNDEIADMYGIPKRDRREFFSLPKKARREVQRWIYLLGKIEQAKPKLAAIQDVSKSSGVNVSSVYRKKREFETYGWRGLVNRAKYPSQKPPMSDLKFLCFVHALWLANDQNYKNTHSQLVAIWRARAPIPGYNGAADRLTRGGIPEGWTYCNLVYHIKSHVRFLAENGTD